MRRSASFVMAFMVLLFGETAQGQLTTGAILGTVKDQTDAVLPGATVTVTNVETGIKRSAVSGNRGEYRIPALAVGTYQVQVSIAGFQTSVRNGIALSIGREAVVDFNLKLGNVAEQVTVTGEAPAIETTTATVSGLVDPKQMRDIPLNARSFLELVPLQAGAVFAESGESSATKGFGRKLSIVGTRYASNLFLLDGADINDAAGVAGSAAKTMAGVETVREFRVVTNAYDAEYGRHTGGVISAITKSGTNQLHGSLFEFLRNDNVDTRNFFDRKQPPEFKRNQFGGAAGGPVIKDRTFFFGSYEGLREGLGLTKTFNVPGIGMRSGFLQGQFVGVDSAVKPFLEAYPTPNTPDRPDGTAQYVTAYTQTTNENYLTARIDHRFSDSDSLFGRFTNDNAEQFRPGASGFNTGAQARTVNRFATAEETHIWSPAFLSRTHFSFSRTNLNFFDIPLKGYVFPKFSFSEVTDIPGILSVSGLAGWGGGTTNPKVHIQNTYQFKEDFFLTNGRHSLKFGGQGERFQFNQRSDFYASGQFQFSSLRDFLTKDVSAARFIKPGSDDIRGWRESVIGLYVHDDINVRPGLTFNIGVRYEFITVPTEANGKVATVRDMSPRHFYTFTADQTDVGNPYFVNPSLKNFAPRVGIAWAPFANGKTSVRAGFGIFYDQIMPNAYITAGVRMAPFFSISEIFGRDLAIDFPNAFFTQRSAVVANIGSAPQADGFQWKVEQPTVMKWSFDLEQQLGSDTTLDVGYSGTRGVHLIRGALNLNATPATFLNGRRYILIDQPILNQHWGRMRWRVTDGTSDYHALRVSLNKRFGRSFQLQSSYTFSKSIDDSSTWTGSTDFGDADRRGYLGEKEPGLSAFDVRHSYFTNLVYEFPWKNMSGAPGILLGGWSASSILRFNSGNPLNIAADQPRRGSLRMQYVDGSTADLIPGGNQNPVRSQNPDHYFDVSQFAFPTPFYQGTLGRNTLISPGVANVDFSLMKDVKLHALGESGALEFRAEFFNIFNRPNFDIPALNLFTQNGTRRSDAGQITGTRTSSRQIQFALRLVF